MSNLKILNVFSIILAFGITSLNCQVIYVKPNGVGNGSSWAQARGDLRQALLSAASGSQIWVASGTYSPTNCTACSDADRRLSFQISDNIAVLGGFAGTETASSQRNWKTNLTVLSGNIDRDTTTKNNSYNVLYTRNVSNSTILDGFIISDGNANDTIAASERTTSGGGWYNDAHDGSIGNPSVKNCIFKNNRSISYGAAMMNNAFFGGQCEATYQNCIFDNNISGREGGAIRNVGAFNGRCNPRFSFCQFNYNHANAAGGAIFNDGINGICNPIFTNCRFTFNTTDTYGGAMYNIGKSGDCSPIISNCLFWANKAFSAGGVYCLGSENGNSSPLITNCVFYKNEANTCGSIYANANDVTGKAAPIILNCIIWGNIATTAPYIRSIESYPKLDYSIIDAPNETAVFQGNVNGHGSCGSHVIYNQNPLFSNPDNGDFRIIPPSLAINAGIDSAVISANLTVDLDSFPRIVDSHVDLGILEYNPAFHFPPRLEQSPTNSTVCEKDTFVLRAIFSGSPPLYFQWYKNGVALPNETSDSIKFRNGITVSDSGSYKCIARNSLNIKDSSLLATIKIKPILLLSIAIQSDRIPVCESDSITLSSATTNGGTRPHFDWRINGGSVGLPDTSTIYRAAVNSIWFRYTCRVTSSEQCVAPRIAVSNEIQFPNILPIDTATLTLQKTTTGIVCAGDTLQFSTTARNPGDTPQYKWYRNNTLINNSLSSLKINNLNNGDTIKAVLTSSKKCLIKNPVESNKIIAAITPRTAISVRATANKTDICAADTVTLTANPTGGGTTPQYQWLLNSTIINGANAFFHKTNTLRDGDKLRVQLISSEICPSAPSVLSDEITIKVNARLTPTISIKDTVVAICPKYKVLFSTNATALGTTPQYQWMRNGLIINNFAPSYTTDSLRTGDSIFVIATSSERCLAAPKAISNTIAPKINVCNSLSENIEQQIAIFPNPSADSRFTLSGLDNFSGEKMITVFNGNGQVVFSEKIKNGVKEAVLDLKNPLSNGFYWVKIANSEVRIYKKWILQK